MMSLERWHNIHQDLCDEVSERAGRDRPDLVDEVRKARDAVLAALEALCHS